VGLLATPALKTDAIARRPTRIHGGKGLLIADNSENGFPVTGLYESETTRQEELEFR
jgi:hypothetical protein